LGGVHRDILVHYVETVNDVEKKFLDLAIRNERSLLDRMLLGEEGHLNNAIDQLKIIKKYLDQIDIKMVLENCTADSSESAITPDSLKDKCYPELGKQLYSEYLESLVIKREEFGMTNEFERVSSKKSESSEKILNEIKRVVMESIKTELSLERLISQNAKQATETEKPDTETATEVTSEAAAETGAKPAGAEADPETDSKPADTKPADAEIDAETDTKPATETATEKETGAMPYNKPDIYTVHDKQAHTEGVETKTKRKHFNV
jgi:hypothetical protein